MPHKLPVYKFETDSVTDVDGNVYSTVKIGSQWWMADNLKVIHYRNNEPMFYNQGLSNTGWEALREGAFCYLGNSSIPFNGPLYNWYAVNDARGIAPVGWHIPSDEEWKKLEQYLGMNADTSNLTSWRGTHEGEMLKSFRTRTNEWHIDQGVGISNKSGFSALPGGCRLFDGTYNDGNKEEKGFWWSSTTQGTDQAWYRYLDYKYRGVFRFYTPKTSGFSVRCVKDAN